VERFEGIANPNPITRVNMAILTYGTRAFITMASFLEDREIEKFFFRTLRSQGIRVKIETN
jgi:hypothetical protein